MDGWIDRYIGRYRDRDKMRWDGDGDEIRKIDWFDRLIDSDR